MRIRNRRNPLQPPLPRLDVEIRNENKTSEVSLSGLKFKIRQMLKALGWKKAGLSVLLTGDRKIRRLNRQYLNHDWATDVLAFGQPKSSFSSGRIPFLGDIVISLETTKKQAHRFGNAFLYELCFYLCHGILHLMGYRDKTKMEAQKMEKIQKRILRQIRIKGSGTKDRRL